MDNMFLGIDISTQSITASVVQIDKDNAYIYYESSCLYKKNEKLLSYGIDEDSMILPLTHVEKGVSIKQGEAMQPPHMFLDALDIILANVQKDIGCQHIRAISVSAQQHGHVYLGAEAVQSFQELHDSRDTNLASVFGKDGVFSYPYAPIWMMSASAEAANQIRTSLGGATRTRQLSGSESPARFTGAVMRYIAQEYGEAYAQTERVHLLSSFMSGVLAGNYEAPIDWGNGAGMTLMDYQKKEWSEILAQAVAVDDNAQTILSKLPPLAAATDKCGIIAEYFVNTYGFSNDCIVCVGSGDNPQSKVPVRGDILSLGTSFVIMAEGSGCSNNELGMDFNHTSGVNAMYDGKNDAFAFACRTNGAIVWDRVRNQLCLEFEECDAYLLKQEIGISKMMWQPLEESFPLSCSFDKQYATDSIQDYAGVIDSTLALLHHYSQKMMQDSKDETLYITGGPSNSLGVIKRVSAFWNRPVVKIASTGASLGAAISAYLGYGQVIEAQHLFATTTQLFQQLIPQILDAQQPYEASTEDVIRAEQYETKIIERFEKFVSE